MYLCYIDESGTPEFSGNTSHFVLAGISIPIWHWKNYEKEIKDIKNKYHLGGTEIHSAWILRPYLEQNKIVNFEKLTYTRRRTEVNSFRKQELLKLQRINNNKRYKQVRKNFKQTEQYIHLTHKERKNYIYELAESVSNWNSARLFAECIDKVYFDPTIASQPIDEQAFEQLVSRFEQFLEHMNKKTSDDCYGIIIYDNNETVSKKHTELMRRFLNTGTLWTNINRIIETPLFVNSDLTGMVQIADLCSYSLRRYLEKDEDELFNLIFQRADTFGGRKVGVRHFTGNGCTCKICHSH